MSIAYNETGSVELATLSAEQRYRQLIENYPGLLHNVPIIYIASFLGTALSLDYEMNYMSNSYNEPAPSISSPKDIGG